MPALRVVNRPADRGLDWPGRPGNRGNRDDRATGTTGQPGRLAPVAGAYGSAATGKVNVCNPCKPSLKRFPRTVAVVVDGPAPVPAPEVSRAY